MLGTKHISNPDVAPLLIDDVRLTGSGTRAASDSALACNINNNKSYEYFVDGTADHTSASAFDPVAWPLVLLVPSIR